MSVIEETEEAQAEGVRHKGAWWEMLISALVGMLAAFVLSIEAWTLAADPTSTFSCDISAKISCTTVALSWQAKLLGFPNAFLGILFEAVVISVAIAALLGSRLTKPFLLSVQALYTIAIAFAYWLFIQSYFVIGALCPWCLTVTITTLLVFMSLLRVNILEGNLFGTSERLRYWVRMGADYWFCGIVAAIVLSMALFKYL